MERSSTRRAAQRQSRHGARPLTEDVRRALRTELLRDTCTADTVAGLFSMSRRTLARHLGAEGYTFRQVYNEVRYEIACALIAETDMTLDQVAAILKYSEPSAFTRVFQRWSGQLPSAWRSSHRRARRRVFNARSMRA